MSAGTSSSRPDLDALLLGEAESREDDGVDPLTAREPDLPGVSSKEDI